MFKWIRRAFKYLFLPLLAIGLVAFFYPEKFLCIDDGKTASGEVIILLGGGAHERPARASVLYHQHVAPRILITGEGDDELNRMALLNSNVPPNIIEIENHSRTTQENALFTVKILRAEHVHTAVIVTSWYHSRRALKSFEHYAPEIKFYSRPSYLGFTDDDWERFDTKRRMRWEFVKLAGYWIRFGINPF